MTSSGPIHHSRFPAQQGQAALLAVTAASSLAHFIQATWEKLCHRGSSGKGIGPCSEVEYWLLTFVGKLYFKGSKASTLNVCLYSPSTFAGETPSLRNHPERRLCAQVSC